MNDYAFSDKRNKGKFKKKEKKKHPYKSGGRERSSKISLNNKRN